MPVTPSPIGSAIRRDRGRLGLTATELGTQLGTKQQTISAWERGRSIPGPKRHTALDEVLKWAPGTAASLCSKSSRADLHLFRPPQNGQAIAALDGALRYAVLARIAQGPVSAEEARFLGDVASSPEQLQAAVTARLGFGPLAPHEIEALAAFAELETAAKVALCARASLGPIAPHEVELLLAYA